PFKADEDELIEAPAGFAMRVMRATVGLMYRIHVSFVVCTGCGLCVQACPENHKAVILNPFETLKEQTMIWTYAMNLNLIANQVILLSVNNS
ncbi:4Fe-4S binding protein, partial [Enterococcus faecalis]|uniref:4Fe-4S binding protein n=1 Tax=Enterococcus faecalis TaxID=1351 RepID=UPI003D6A49AD